MHTHLMSSPGSQQYTQKYNLNCEHKHIEMPNNLAQRKLKHQQLDHA
jgi:hypothetical protein